MKARESQKSRILSMALALLLLVMVGCGSGSESQGGSKKDGNSELPKAPDSEGAQVAEEEPIVSSSTIDGASSSANQPLPDTVVQASEVGEPTEDVNPENIVKFKGGLRVYLGVVDERVEVDVTLIANPYQPLEYILVTRAGASHEALLQMDCEAYNLKQAMELLLLREGKTKLRFRGDPNPPQGDLIDVDVLWRDNEDKLHLQRIEEWVFNRVTKKVMTHGPWVFTGSHTFHDESINRDIFLADDVGNVMAVWRDPSCVIDNPRESATNDMAYTALHDEEALPGRNSQVRLIIRKHDPERLKGAAKDESQPGDVEGVDEPSEQEPKDSEPGEQKPGEKQPGAQDPEGNS